MTAGAFDRVAYRQSRARRSTLIALLSTTVFAAVLLFAVTSAPGWPRVRDSFFNLRIGWDSLPALLEGLWLNIRVLIVCQVLVLVFGLGLAAVRTLRGPHRVDGAEYRDQSAVLLQRDEVIEQCRRHPARRLGQHHQLHRAPIVEAEGFGSGQLRWMH